MAKHAGNREHLLAIAESHMLDKGFGATTIDEIIAASKLSRSGFFYHFQDRNELARGLMQRFVEQDDELLDTLFARARELHDDPLHALLIGLTLLSEMMADLPQGHPGCLVATFCYAERSFDRDVHLLNRQALLGWRQRFVDMFAEIDACHPLPPQTPVEALADTFGTTIEGGIILSRAANCPRLLVEQLLLLRSHVKLLLSSSRDATRETLSTDSLMSIGSGNEDDLTTFEEAHLATHGKRDYLLDIAEAGVLSKGFDGTSVEEMAAEAGITKGGFFYHFKDKQELACALLQRTIQRDTKRLHACFAYAAMQHDDPLAQLSIVLNRLAEPRIGTDAGCHGSLVGTFCSTPGVVDAEARALLRQALKTWREPFSAVLQHAAECYPLTDNVALDALANRIFSTLEGGIVMAKSLGDAAVFGKQIQLLRSYLDLLFTDSPRTLGDDAV